MRRERLNVADRTFSGTSRVATVESSGWPGADWRLGAIDMSKRILTPAAFWALCSLWEARPFDRRSPRVDFSDLGLVCRRHEARIPILLEGPRHPAVK